jgi:hypothetical protein
MGKTCLHTFFAIPKVSLSAFCKTQDDQAALAIPPEGTTRPVVPESESSMFDPKYLTKAQNLL